MARRWLVGLGALLFAACSVTTSLDGFAGDAPIADEGGLEGAVTEASDDVVVLSPTLGQPIVIATDVGVAFAVGAAQQTHLHYAKNAREWRLFYIKESDKTHLRTRVSRDFANWIEGSSLALPQDHPGDGRSFAVAYADIDGRDVFHVSISLKANSADRRHHHARATMVSGKLIFENLTELGKVTADEATLDPDGPAVAILPGGKVVDLSGWYSLNGTDRMGNVVAWVSTTNDDAAAWTPAFAPPYEVQVVQLVCNARALVPLADGALALWEAADEDPEPKGVSSARLENGLWKAAASAGFVSEAFDPNDWGAAALGKQVHAVRFSGAAFVHRVWENGQWSSGPGFPAREHPVGQGVAVVSDGTSLFAFGLDAAGALRSTSFTSGEWSAWKTDVPGGPTRSRPSAYAGSAGIAVLWGETTGGRRDIVGARLR